MSPKDFNEPFRMMEEAALHHLKLNQPERYPELEKSNQLKAWVNPRVESGEKEFEPPVERGLQPPRARELTIRHNLLVEYIPEELDHSQNCYF